jgi:hypothetical protein
VLVAVHTLELRVVHMQALELRMPVKELHSQASQVPHSQVLRALHMLELGLVEELLQLDRSSWPRTHMLRRHSGPSSCDPPCFGLRGSGEV